MESFLSKCFVSNAENSCYVGYIILLIGVIIIILNIIAFILMTIFYGKMNFENTLLLLSSVQSITLLVEVISSYHYYICIFIFFQILIMCLINIKFRKISQKYLHINYHILTKIIIVVNILFFIVCIIIWAINYELDFFFIKIFYYLLQTITSILLAHHCCVFLGLINHDQQSKEGNRTKDNSLDTSLMNDGLFYLIKQKQLSVLYLTNIICSLLELIVDILDFYINSDYLYYLFFLICFIHNSSTFITFYWIIKKQYAPKISTKNNGENKRQTLIDSNYIEKEVSNIEEENKRIVGYLNDDKNSRKFLNAGSNELEKINRKLSENDKESVNRKPSRASTFSENDLNNVIIIEDNPTKKNK